MTAEQTVIVYAKRTAIGKMSGVFSDVPAPQLGATLVKDALVSTGIEGSAVDEMIMGNVLTAGVGQAPARQAAILGGLPSSVCATTVNRVCGSGIKAIMMADQTIRLGEARIVFAGGQENMTLAPHMLPRARSGYRFGPFEVKDHMQWDGLWDPYNNVAMGSCGEICAREKGFSRKDQDDFAIESYRRAQAAIESGHFAREIVPVVIQTRKGTVTVATDEEPGAADFAKLRELKPAFDKEGSVTAGNSSSINDGAALVVAMSESEANRRNLKPLARILAQASHAQDPKWFTTAPIGCIEKVLKRANIAREAIDIFEINEAFAVVAMAAMRELKLAPAKVNPYGGAVALGHPIGASGARVVVTLLNGLKARGQRYGLATLCIGGGEASAIVVEAL